MSERKKIETRILGLQDTALAFAKEDQYAETVKKLNKLFEGIEAHQNLHLGDIPLNALQKLLGLTRAYSTTGKWPRKIVTTDRDARDEAGYHDMFDHIANRLLDILREEFPEREVTTHRSR